MSFVLLFYIFLKYYLINVQDDTPWLILCNFEVFFSHNPCGVKQVICFLFLLKNSSLEVFSGLGPFPCDDFADVCRDTIVYCHVFGKS